MGARQQLQRRGDGDEAQRPRVLQAYGGRPDTRPDAKDVEDLSIQLFNGCDVLIATPHKLETLLRTNAAIGGGGGGGGGAPKTNLFRLYHVVFVEADRLMSDRFFPSVERLMKRYAEELKQFDSEVQCAA